VQGNEPFGSGPVKKDVAGGWGKNYVVLIIYNIYEEISD